MEETKETKEISLVSSVDFLVGGGGVKDGLLGLLGLLRLLYIEIIVFSLSKLKL